jgi:hypothetical protein
LTVSQTPTNFTWPNSSHVADAMQTSNLLSNNSFWSSGVCLTGFPPCSGSQQDPYSTCTQWMHWKTVVELHWWSLPAPQLWFLTHGVVSINSPLAPSYLEIQGTFCPIFCPWQCLDYCLQLQNFTEKLFSGHCASESWRNWSVLLAANLPSWLYTLLLFNFIPLF